MTSETQTKVRATSNMWDKVAQTLACEKKKT